MGRDLERLARIARTLSRAAHPIKSLAAKGLPPLILVTDPDRTPDPVDLAERLPRGSGVIFRGFGRPGARKTARKLAKTARRRGLVLLIGAGALRIPGAGVHLPERLGHRAGAFKRARPGAIVTVAAHSLPALIRARRAGADAAVLSTVFRSKSPSAGPPARPGAVRRPRPQGRPAGLCLGGVKTKTPRGCWAPGRRVWRWWRGWLRP
ncbi:MAG: thiamine phosphate synthase [Caulobacteraceae bacterium]